jgi:hypothetical protein
VRSATRFGYQQMSLTSTTMVIERPGNGKNIHLQPLFVTKIGSKVRRIQLKFASAKEFEAAIDHVHQLGLYMTAAQGSVPSAPQNLARPQSGGPSCPPSKLSEITSRPFTAAAATAHPLQTPLLDAAARPFSARPLRSDPLTPPVYFQRPDSASTISTPDRYSELPTVTESRLMSADHPDTATVFGRPSTSELPPRRELPFQRPDTPKSRGSEGGRPGSRPTSSLMGPPPLPSSRAGRQCPTSTAGNNPAIELPVLPKPTPLANAHVGPQSIGSPSRRTHSRGTGGVSRPKSALTAQKENQQLASSPPLFRPATSDSTARNHPLSAVGDSAQNERMPAPSAFLPTPPASDANYQSPLSPEGNNRADAALAELGVYAKQPDEVRMNALNSFILRHLEDDNFLALVDDMDQCWARIAPGFG